MKIYTLFIIILLRLLSALPFAVYYSSLQLYLLKAPFSQNIATALVGSVLALSFGASLIGGMLAGKYISYRAFLIFCMLCQVVGCFTFTTFNQHVILWFMSLFLLGSTGITVSLNMMLTQPYKAHDYAREKAFFWFYMFLNLGYLLGYSLAGYYGNAHAYHYIPIVISLFAVIGVIIAALHWNIIDQKIRSPLAGFCQFLLIMMGLFFIIRLFLQFSQVANLALIAGWIIISLFMFGLLTKKFPTKKTEIITFYILLLSALIFWSAYFLAPMALIIFIKYHVALQIGHVLLAPQWIQTINTLVIIVGTIYFGSKKTSLNTNAIVAQFSVGLLSLGLGFGLLAFSIYVTPPSAKISLIWIICSYILQSTGELLIGPIGYALIGRLIPKPHHSLMMGIWITLLGVAGAIASKLSTLAPYSKHTNTLILAQYQHFFLSIGLIAIIAAGLVYTASQKIARPMTAEIASDIG